MYDIAANIEHLFKKYGRSLTFLGIKLTKNKEVAKDIVSMTFAKLLERHITVESEEKAKGYIYTSVANACKNLLKYDARHPTDYVDDMPKTFSFLSEDTTAIHAIIKTETYRLLMEEIEKLPYIQNKICMMFFFEGISCREIASKSSMNIKTVRNLKAIAVDNLKYNFLKRKITNG